MSKPDLKITNRFWSDMATVLPYLLNGIGEMPGGGESVPHPLGSVTMADTMRATAQQLIVTENLLVSSRAEIVFGADGEVYITERELKY